MRLNIKIMYTIIIIIILLMTIAFVLHDSKKISFNINAEEVKKIKLGGGFPVLSEDYYFVIENKEEVKKVIKSLNKIACYATDDDVGELYLLITLYGENDKEIAQINFYGGMAGMWYTDGSDGKKIIIDGEIYETGLLTNLQLRRLCRALDKKIKE